MNAGVRSYRYVGPADIAASASSDGGGAVIRSSGDFAAWVSSRSAEELADPFTFVVDDAGFLRLAPRRSEHVACAAGGRVLSAGEIRFLRGGDRWAVAEVSNHSTGYCPDAASWPAVAAALDAAEIPHSGGFTHEVVFRRCPACDERTVVKDGDLVCVFCGSELPSHWNVDSFHDKADEGP